MEDKVILNVYSLTKMNYLLKPLGVGIYHCGIEVYGLEYTFYTQLGVVTCNPKKAPNCDFVESKVLDSTKYTEVEVQEMVDELAVDEFSSKEYHLTRNNCHHFCQFFGKWCIQDIALDFYPNYINRSTKFFKSLDFMLPKSWIRGIGSSSMTISDNNNNQAHYADYLSTSTMDTMNENKPLLEDSSGFKPPSKQYKENKKRITKKKVATMKHRNCELRRRVQAKVQILTTQEQQIEHLETRKRELQEKINEKGKEVEKVKKVLPVRIVEKIERGRRKKKTLKKNVSYFDDSSSGESASEGSSDEGDWYI